MGALYYKNALPNKKSDTLTELTVLRWEAPQARATTTEVIENGPLCDCGGGLLQSQILSRMAEAYPLLFR